MKPPFLRVVPLVAAWAAAGAFGCGGLLGFEDFTRDDGDAGDGSLQGDAGPAESGLDAPPDRAGDAAPDTAGCTNQCTSAAEECSSATAIQTCQPAPSGCAVLVAQPCASGNVCARHGGVACVDPNWAEWPMPNTPPDVPPAPNPASYTDGADGTVTDNVTSLVWQKAISGTYTRAAAIAYCTGLRLAAHSDWRVPTYIELISILDYGKQSPAADTRYFADAVDVWSSNMTAGSTTEGMVVSFKLGQTSSAPVANALNVRCVR